MNRGIIYMLIGARHLPVTAVSIRSLRKWWDGPISLFCGDAVSQQFGELIAKAAGADFHKFEPKIQKRHIGYASKPMIPLLSPYDQTIQIDGDTVVVGKLDELWPQNDKEVVLTRFGDWTTQGRIVSNRIKAWADVALEEVTVSLRSAYPALNTGVLSYNKTSELTSYQWAEMVARKPKQFISDEIAMQLLYPFAPNVRLAPNKFNFSPMYGKGDDLSIIHLHGKKHLRKESINFWWPEYKATYLENFADIQGWTPAGDDRLSEKSFQEWDEINQQVAMETGKTNKDK